MEARITVTSRAGGMVRVLQPVRWLAALLLALPLGGCIIVPVGAFTEAPFPAELRQKLAPGQADRDRVRQLLGSPTTHKAGGQYWFYARSRATWGIIGGTSSAVFSDEEWLAVEFDAAGRVVFLEHGDDAGQCLSNGICMLSGLFSTQPSSTVVTAPRVQDQAARNHPAGPDRCAIYFYLESLPWLYKFATVHFSVDGQPLGQVTDHAYLFTTHPVGELRISAYQLRTELPCEGGKKLYVKAVKARDHSWETGQTLTLVSEREAEAALQTRKLALPD